MSEITKVNHYVPQSLQRRWSQDEKHVYAYRTLVSHPDVPVWQLKSISKLAFHRDLYTQAADGREVDVFEKWISTQFEDPGFKAVNKIVDNARLISDDWHNLARLFAAQDVRTPSSFIELSEWWDETLRPAIDESLVASVAKVQHAMDNNIPLIPPKEPNELGKCCRIHIDGRDDPTADKATIRLEVLVGRKLWIASMRHVLTGIAETLCKHRWSIAQPCEGEEFPLTDHPAIRLNYYKPGRYDFKGGWGKLGTELMMPISPRHLLYVQVGKKHPNRFSFSRQQTRLVQELIVERAHRWVFTCRPENWVVDCRPRVVDMNRFAEEEKGWKEWSVNQLDAELAHETTHESSRRERKNNGSGPLL